MELFSVMAKLVLDKGGFDNDVKNADQSGKSLAENLSGYMEKAGKIIKGIFAVATIKKVASAVWDLAKETSAAGDRIDKQSQALGMSRKAFQEWDYILSQSGASIDSLGATMKTMNAAILENSADTAAGLSKLGLSAAKLQSLSPEDQFEAIVKAFQGMPESAEKSQLAIQLLGRNAQSLMPLLNSSADSVDELRKRAQELGLIMDDDAVDASVAFGDALDDLNKTWTALKQKFGAQLLPGFTKGLIAAANALGRISNAVSESFKSGDWSGTFTAITEEIGKLIPGFVDTVVNIVTGIFENADKLVDMAMSIVEGVTSGIVKALPKLIEKLPEIGRRILSGLQAVAMTLGQAVIDTINAVFGTNIPSFDIIVEWVQEKWQEISAALKIAAEWVGKAWTTTVKWVQNAWDTVSSALTTAGEWIGQAWTTTVNWVQNAWDKVSSAFTEAGKWVSNTANQISLAWKSTVDDWVKTISDWLSGKISFDDLKLKFKSTIDTWIKKIAEWLRGIGLGAVVDFGAKVANWFDTIKSWLDGTGWKQLTLNIGATVSNWIQRIYDWITNGIKIVVDFFDGGSSGSGYKGDINQSGAWNFYNQTGMPPAGLRLNEDTNMWEYNAKGLNYVPWDGYRAILHRGEMILNQDKGREYRQNGGGGMDYQTLYNTVSSAVSAAVASIQINMDGKAVGNAVTEQVSRNIYQQLLGKRVGLSW